MKILFISNLFPNTIEPHRAAFSRQQISALNKIASVDVIAPIAWTKFKKFKIPTFHTINGVSVYHPIFWYSPYILRNFYGYLYYLSIYKVATKLLDANKYDVIYSSWLYPDVWAAARLAKKYNLPFVGKVVGTDVNRLLLGTSITAKSIMVTEQASAMVSVSRRLKERLVELGADKSKITVIDNGVDRSIFYPMDKDGIYSELGISPNNKRILFVGNLLKTKGLRELIMSFGILVKNGNYDNLVLDLIGDGPFLNGLRHLVLEEGVEDRVNFRGTMPQRDISKWMNACDVFCLPSYSEGQPNVVLEALACGARTVATNVGGIPDLDRGQPSLRLIAPQSVTSLVEGLDDMLRADIPRCANDFIISWDDNAEILLKIFKDVVGCHRKT